MLHFDKQFQKQYKKLKPQLQEKVDLRLQIFLADPYDPRLRLHPLKGDFFGYYSINITGDLRALFYRDEKTIVFALLGTHSQLY